MAKKAPFNDLKLCKDLIRYKDIDPAISQAASNKIMNHLWYLNSENIAL